MLLMACDQCAEERGITNDLIPGAYVGCFPSLYAALKNAGGVDQVITLYFLEVPRVAKVKVEFINTCPCCVGYEEYIKEVAARYPDEVGGQNLPRR